MVEGLDESFRRRVKTLSEKMKQTIQREMVLGVEDGSEVVCLRCRKEFMFFQRRRGLGIDD